MAVLSDGAGLEGDRPQAEAELSPAGHRWLIVGVIIAGACVFLQLYATQPLLPLFRRVFHASEAQVSLIVSCATLAVALTSPFVGMLADAIGRKRVIVPSLFAIALATLACSMVDSLGALIFWRFVAGAFTPGVIAVTMAYISEESPPRTTAWTTSLYITGTVIGGLTGRLSSAFTADHYAWPAVFVVVGLMTLAGACCTWWLLPRSRRFHRQTQWSSTLRAMGQHLRNKRLLATYFAGFDGLLSHVGLFTYAVFYLAAPPFSLSTSAQGSIFLVYGLGIVVTPLSGRLIDRMGHRAGAILAVSTVIAGVLLTLVPSLWVFIVGIALASAGVFIAQASATSHIGEVAQGSRSAASGLYVACYYLGGSVGATALVIPWKLGGWPAVIGSIIGVQLLLLLAAWRYYNRTGRQERRTEALAALE